MQRRTIITLIAISLLLGILLWNPGSNNAKAASSPVLSSYPFISGWTLTGSLNEARQLHTSTLLPNGKTLIYGGYSGGSGVFLYSAELFDPATGNWTSTNGSFYDRLPSATLLTNGRVLVIGGTDVTFPARTPSAELYDPPSGNWYATGRPLFERVEHTATLLPNGKVLVAGGHSGNSPFHLNTAELYDPATQVWSRTGNLHAARFGHTATLLQNGKVLIVGGLVSNGDPFSAELYDPATGSWTLTSGVFYERFGHTATLLQNGKVIIAGGRRYNSPTPTLNSVEIYDPASGNWYATGPLHDPREDHTATLLPNGKVLVAGGLQYARPQDVRLSSAEVYDPVTQVWTTVASLNVARLSHAATLLPNGSVLVSGGRNASTYPDALNSAELFDSAETCSSITVFPASLPAGAPGTPYSQTFAETGGSGTIVWSISSGALPNGLTLNPASGVLSGTPSVTGTFNFTARANNGNCFGERFYTVVVKLGSATVLSVSTNPAAAGQPLTLTARVSVPGGGNPTGTVRFKVNGLPVGNAVTVAGGTAVLNTTAPAGGSRGTAALSAVYSGDGTYQSSTGSLTLMVFDLSVQDNTTGDYLLFSANGNYLFGHCSGKTTLILTGQGTASGSSCTASLVDVEADRTLKASVNSCPLGQSGAAKIAYQGVTYSLTDSNIMNNTNRCQ